MKAFHCREINLTISINELKQCFTINFCETFGGIHELFNRDNHIAVQVVGIEFAW